MAHPDDEFSDPLYGEQPPLDEGVGREGRAGFVPEFVRKVAVAGLGALFMTEEGIRSLAGQMKLPKEVLTFILSQAKDTKDDIGRIVSEEIRRFMQSEKLREEFVKLVSQMTIEVKAEIRLKPKHEGAAASASTAAAAGDGGAAPTSEPEFVVTEVGTKRRKRKE